MVVMAAEHKALLSNNILAVFQEKVNGEKVHLHVKTKISI